MTDKCGDTIGKGYTFREGSSALAAATIVDLCVGLGLRRVVGIRPWHDGPQGHEIRFSHDDYRTKFLRSEMIIRSVVVSEVAQRHEQPTGAMRTILFNMMRRNTGRTC